MFVHLSVHSEFALADGLCRIQPLIQRCRDLAMPAVAITDPLHFFGALKFTRHALSSGIQPILGVEATLSGLDAGESGAVRLLCKTERGYRLLCEAISDAYLATPERPTLQLATFQGAGNDIICLSGGETGPLSVSHREFGEQRTLDVALQLLEIFKNSFYIEIERINNTTRSDEPRLLDLARRRSIPIVAANRVRFLEPEQSAAQFLRQCIAKGVHAAEARPSVTEQQYLKSPEEMRAVFNDLPEAVENTLHIAKRCGFVLPVNETHYHLPPYPCSAATDEKTLLQEKAESGLNRRLSQNQIPTADHRDQYNTRLNHELDIIIDMGFPGYFLIVADFIEWARRHDIPVGPGRGSGAGSLVSYALGITSIDPIKHGLLFERFLNPERVSMPDLDIDFCIDGRDRVIQYVREQYTPERVSQIITYSTLASRAVVRDVARVLGYPYSMGDAIARAIPGQPGITLQQACLESENLRKGLADHEDWRRIVDASKELEGLPRNVGRHAGGIVIAPKKLHHYTALYLDPDNGGAVTHFDKDDLEAIGLVKFDFLGLRNLTIIKKTIEAVSGEKPLDIDTIPLDDEKTYELIQQGNTTAVFQLESSGIKKLMRKLKPDRFEDLVALVALYRPGPLQSGMVNDFVECKHGRQDVKYPHPKLKGILQNTYGIIVYQEQVMEIARQLAGYTLGEADLLRRAMGKKKPQEMEKQRSVFKEGARQNDVDETLATYIFDLMEKFAGYGFNKSHSVAYALIAYQTAYLKAHYPARFMAAVLNSELHNPDKLIITFDECWRLGLSIRRPSFRYYSVMFQGDDDQKTIAYGLAAMRGVGRNAARKYTVALDTLNKRSERITFHELVSECIRQDLGKRSIEALIHGGALDETGLNRQTMIENLASVYTFSEKKVKDENTGQGSLFEDVEKEKISDFPLQSYDEYPALPRLARERSVLHMYCSGHPMESITPFIAEKYSKISALHELDIKEPRTSVRIVGSANNVKILSIQNRGKLGVLDLDDGTDRCHIKVYSDVLDRTGDTLEEGAILVVDGQFLIDDYDDTEQQTTVLASHIRRIDDIGFIQHATVHLSLPITKKNDNALKKNIVEHLKQFSEGSNKVVIHYVNDHGHRVKTVTLSEEWSVCINRTLMHELQELCGDDNVKIEF